MDLSYFGPGRTINLYGYAPADGKFVIDLVPRNADLYHDENVICLRLEVDVETYHISRSSLAHGTEWYDAETDGYSGLERGRYFQLTIVVQLYSYAIMVNGYHFATYQHRIPFYKEMTITLDDRVAYQPIEYN